MIGRFSDGLREAGCTDCGKDGCAGTDLGDPLCFRRQAHRNDANVAYSRKQRQQRGTYWDRWTVERLGPER